MSRFVMIAATVTMLAVVPAHAASKAAFSVAKDGTTNIADCGKAAPAVRNECISRARPVMGKEIYAQVAAQKATEAKKAALESAKAMKAGNVAKVAAAKAAHVKTPVPAKVKVTAVAKGFKMAKDGSTNIADCAKAPVDSRNECISRARPLTAGELANFEKSRAVTATVVAAKPVAKPVAAKPVAAPTPVLGKGFKIAKDGTTDIADCAKANPDFRNECISRARPVSGKAIYASVKSKS